MMLTLVKVTMDHVAMNWTFGKQTLSALPTQTTLVKLQVQVLYIMMNNVKIYTSEFDKIIVKYPFLFPVSGKVCKKYKAFKLQYYSWKKLIELHFG